MTQTFTPPTIEIAANNTDKEQKQEFLNVAEPSLQVIQNILSYSKNLEVKKSEMMNDIEFIKSWDCWLFFAATAELIYYLQLQYVS